MTILESDGEDDVWVEKAERALQEHGPEAIRTTVVIETVADPLGIYKEYDCFVCCFVSASLVSIHFVRML